MNSEGRFFIMTCMSRCAHRRFFFKLYKFIKRKSLNSLKLYGFLSAKSFKLLSSTFIKLNIFFFFLTNQIIIYFYRPGLISESEKEEEILGVGCGF